MTKKDGLQNTVITKEILKQKCKQGHVTLFALSAFQETKTYTIYDKGDPGEGLFLIPSVKEGILLVPLLHIECQKKIGFQKEQITHMNGLYYKKIQSYVVEYEKELKEIKRAVQCIREYEETKQITKIKQELIHEIFIENTFQRSALEAKGAYCTPIFLQSHCNGIAFSFFVYKNDVLYIPFSYYDHFCSDFIINERKIEHRKENMIHQLERIQTEYEESLVYMNDILKRYRMFQFS